MNLEPVAGLPVDLPATPDLETIREVQRRLTPMPQVECPVRHQFAPGMYVRTCAIPAGSVVVGKQHRHVHPVMLIKGETTILTDKGMERISAPHVWISQPGAKRILYTHTDCEFTTVHLNPTDTTDLDALEADIIIPEPQLAHDSAPEIADLLQEVYA